MYQSMMFLMLTHHVVPAVLCCCCVLAGSCTWRDCQHKATCKGNRVEPVPGAVQRLPLPSRSVNAQLVVQQYRLVAPHHKSERHRGRAIEYQLPQELCLLLHFHLRHGLRVIMSSGNEEEDEDHAAYDSLAHIFVMASTRKPLVKQQPSQVWRRVVLPEAYNFGPQVARSAFATGIRNQQLPRPEFSAAAAAEAMGHSLKVWDTTYDRLYTQQAVQRSVDLMASWRQEVLQLQTQQEQAAAAAAAAAAVAANLVVVDDDDDELTAAAAEEAAAACDLGSSSDGAGSDEDSWLTAGCA
jgi:hypothetical protein